MRVSELIVLLQKMPQDAKVGREANDDGPMDYTYFEEYKVCVKADEADGNLVFIF